MTVPPMPVAPPPPEPREVKPLVLGNKARTPYEKDFKLNVVPAKSVVVEEVDTPRLKDASVDSEGSLQTVALISQDALPLGDPPLDERLESMSVETAEAIFPRRPSAPPPPSLPNQTPPGGSVPTAAPKVP